jgi:hypothetical protein
MIEREMEGRVSFILEYLSPYHGHHLCPLGRYR